MVSKKRKAKITNRNSARKTSTPNGTVYRSATTGRYVTRSPERDPSAHAREIRERFRIAGRRFSDFSEIVREDRDAG